MSKRVVRFVVAFAVFACLAPPVFAATAAVAPASAQVLAPPVLAQARGASERPSAEQGAAAAPQGQGAETAPNPRIALVIGESSYADATLATTANDAALVAQTLQAAGFDVVGARDLDDKALRGALKDFVTKAASIGPGMQAFIYFSGRAVQYEGENFLVPVDAQIGRASDTPVEAVRVSDFTHALAAAPGAVRILVIDGARATPYAQGDAPLAPGLALVEPDAGALVAFNASPDAVAADESGDYGVFGKTLAGAMREGGLPLDAALTQTRVQVNEATKGAQIPWFASKLTEPYFVFERAADAPPPPAATAIAEAERKPIRSFPADEAYSAAVQRDTLPAYQDYLAAYPDAAQARRVRAILAARREALFWRRSIAADTPRGYWTYLRVYPRGPHAADARRRLAVLAARQEPPADFAPVVYMDLPPPPPDEIVDIERPYWANVDDFGPPPPPPPSIFAPVFEPAWANLPRPARPTVYGVLPTLTVALPLLVTARAYHDAGGRRGFAPADAPRIAPPPPGPPRLPPNIKIKPPTTGPKIAQPPATTGTKPPAKDKAKTGPDSKPQVDVGKPAMDGKAAVGVQPATTGAKPPAKDKARTGPDSKPQVDVGKPATDGKAAVGVQPATTGAKPPAKDKAKTSLESKPLAKARGEPAPEVKLPQVDGGTSAPTKGAEVGAGAKDGKPKARDARAAQPADKLPTKLAKPPAAAKPAPKPSPEAVPRIDGPKRACGKPGLPPCP